VEELTAAATEVKVPQVVVKVDQVAVVVKVDQVAVKADQVAGGMEEVVKVVVVAWVVMPFFPMHSGVHHFSMMSLR
jgi:hypothetical protein|tara:strand:+ start:108 stop:335 length:228 start_codon:yes stop_codon:yes gene_type:complete